MFEKASEALSDDYEGVRSVATKLIWVLSQVYPERSVDIVLRVVITYMTHIIIYDKLMSCELI